MQTLLLGMNNPHHDDPRHDLFPAPKNCTGWRIWKMLHDRAGVSKKDYVLAFHRFNLVHGRSWTEPSIQEAALRLSFVTKPDMTVIVLGQQVLNVVNQFEDGQVKKVLIHPQRVRDLTYRFLPHPSGRNLFYNDPVQRELVAMLLEDLYKESDYAKTKKDASRSTEEDGQEAHQSAADDPR